MYTKMLLCLVCAVPMIIGTEDAESTNDQQLSACPETTEFFASNKDGEDCVYEEQHEKSADPRLPLIEGTSTGFASINKNDEDYVCKITEEESANPRLPLTEGTSTSFASNEEYSPRPLV